MNWVSAETEDKERDFRGLLTMHANICKGIMRREATTTPYLYVDLYAGRGNLDFQGRSFDGSPLIARDVLTDVGFPYEAVHYEQEKSEAELLVAALAGRSSTLFPREDPVHVESCQAGFPLWLDERGHQPDRYGLIYADPIHDEIQHGLLNHAAKLLPRVDLLSYVSATQYKRRRGCNPNRPYLADHIRAVNKKVALIRERRGCQQWTFVLWSNWANLPQWEQRDFYRLDTPRGRRILERLDLSKNERRAKAETSLPELIWGTS